MCEKNNFHKSCGDFYCLLYLLMIDFNNFWKTVRQKLLENQYKLPELTTSDCFLVMFLTIATLINRFWKIEYPNSVVFDEVYFGNFTNYYIKGSFYFDIHPPLAKLLMFFIAKYGEYNGTIEFSKKTWHPYESIDYVLLRITPAFFSAFCSPLIYLSMRFAQFSRCASFSAGCLISFDTTMLSEGRFILTDGILHFFTCLNLAFMSYTLQIPRSSTKFWILMFFTGITLGFACSVKNTAWGLCLLNAIIHFFELFVKHNRFTPRFFLDLINRGLVLIFPLLIIYIGSFIIHFKYLPYNGPGDPYIDNEMKKELLSKDENGLQLRAFRLTGENVVFRSIKMSLIMHIDNMGITEFHPSQSLPFNWPLLTGIWVGFYAKGDSVVYCTGNVFSYYLGFAGIIINLIYFGYLMGSKELNLIPKKDYVKFIASFRWFLGWAVSYFPFFLIPRAMYLYHYIIPLIFACAAFGSSLDLCFFSTFKGTVTIISVTLAFIGFVLLSPFSYGSKSWDESIVIWNKNWKIGDETHRSQAVAASKTLSGIEFKS